MADNSINISGQNAAGLKVVSKGGITDVSYTLDIEGAKLKHYGEINAKFLSKTSVEEFARKIESPAYIEEYIKDRKSFFPSVDFQDPKNFVKFGIILLLTSIIIYLKMNIPEQLDTFILEQKVG
jgi:hypothetical protein